MKVGDLVTFSLAGMTGNQVGIILSFDDEDDPVIWISPEGYQYTEYRSTVKVISESG